MKIQFLLIVAVAFLFQSCSYVTTLRTRELNKVEDQVKLLNAQMDSMQNNLDSMRLANEKSNRKLQADLRMLIQLQQQGTERLGARLEETQHSLDQIHTRPVVTPSPTKATKQTAQPTATVNAEPDSATLQQLELEKLYSTARSDFSGEHYKEAYTGFKEIYERDKSGTLAEKSLYWMAVCLQESKQNPKAQKVFEQVLKEFPEGPKSCPSLARLARIERDAKNEEARRSWLKLLTSASQCIGTNEALRAEEMLKQP